MADEQAVLNGFKGWIENNDVLSGLIQAVYTDLPNFGQEIVPAPWLLIQPGTMVEDRVSTADVQMRGYITFLYFDELGEQSGLSVGAIMANARSFMKELRFQIHLDYTIGGHVVWAGEGDGITVHYSDAGEVRPVADQSYYCLPMDVDTLFLPEDPRT